MKKDVNKFKKELAEYINTHIVGHENTFITECVISDKILNRGHVIPVQVRMPDEMMDIEDFKTIGPAFYAEELMEEFPDGAIKTIAKAVNDRVNEVYPAMMTVLDTQLKALKRTMDDYDKDDFILTALPTSQNPNIGDPFITKELPEFGLTVSMKACVCRNPQNKDQSYFTHVRRKEGQCFTKEAENHRLRAASIHISFASVPSTILETPIAGQIVDANGFYDYFYLLSVAPVWKEIVKMTRAERIFLIPDGAYAVKFAVDNSVIRDDSLICTLRDNFLKAAQSMSNNTLSVFILDGETLNITKMNVGE